MKKRGFVSRFLALFLCFIMTFSLTISNAENEGDLVVNTDLPDGAVVVVENQSETPKEEPLVVEATAEPDPEPTEAPTAEPTAEPTPAPTEVPTVEPTMEPTAEPTEVPTVEPTMEPTAEPTMEPTAEPTEVPSAEPTAEPTLEPTEVPAEEPKVEPTEEPNVDATEEPEAEATEAPKEIFKVSVRFVDDDSTEIRNRLDREVVSGGSFYLRQDYKLPEVEGYEPYRIKNAETKENFWEISRFKEFIAVANIEHDVTFYVYYRPVAEATVEPTTEPTSEPTEEPVVEPTTEPTSEPTEEPVVEPTTEPTSEPTEEPVVEPTAEPTPVPTEEPVVEPTTEPTSEPTEEPVIEPAEGDEDELMQSTMMLLSAFALPSEANGEKVYAVVCDGVLLGKYAPGAIVNLTVPTKSGYDFIGWKVVCSKSVTITGNQFTMPDAPVGVVSQWKAQTHQIAIYYITGSGANLYEAKFSEVMSGSSFTLDGSYQIPAIEGYTATSIKHGSDVYTNISDYMNIIKVDNVQNDEVFQVVYEPADTSYVVKHYRQDLNGNYPEELMESENFSGKYGDVVEITPHVKSYAGFSWRGFAIEEATSITLAGSNNEIKIYYSREQYRLFYVDGASTLWYDVKYEENVNIGEKFGVPAPRADAVFIEWVTDDTSIKIADGSFKMPAHDVVFNSKWKPNETASYHVYYYIESVESANKWTRDNHRNGSGDTNPSNDADYQFHGSVKLTGATNAVVEKDVVTANANGVVDTAHFTYSKMDEGVTINPDGTTIVKVYYRRNVYYYEFRYYIKNSSNRPLYTWDGHNQGRLFYKYEADLTDAGITNSWPYNGNGGRPIQWVQDAGGNNLPAISAPTSANLGYNYTIYHNGEASHAMGFKYIKQNLNGQYASDSESGVLVQFFYKYDQKLSITLRAYRCPEGFSFERYTTDGGKSGTIPPVSQWPDNNGSPGFLVEDSSCNWATIYFSRNKYTISFSNGNNVVATTAPIYYQADVPNASNANVPSFETLGIPDAFKVGYEFAGFEDSNNSAVYAGSTPAEAYESFIAVNGTMPARNILLTAKWKLKTYKVNFYKDVASIATGSTLMSEQIVEYSKLVPAAPETPTRLNYDFGGWYYRDVNGVEKPWIADATRVSADMDIYAKWNASEQVITDITVIHRYLADDKVTVVDEVTETKQGVVGSTVTIEALQRDGYFPDFAAQNCEVKDEDNVVVFNYVPIEEVEYTVYYVDENGNNLISPVVKITKNMIVTENYVYIPNCTPRVIAQELRVTANPEDNVITFVYDVVGTTEYTIKYWQEQLDGSYLEVEADRLVISEVRYYTEVSVTAEQKKEYPGYSFNEGISNLTAWLMPGEEVILNLYYDLKEHTVTYKYSATIDGVTMPELPATQTHKFGETVFAESNNLTIEGKPEYVFKGWYREGDAVPVEVTSFEMPDEDVVLYGYFELSEYYITVEWTREDGVYHGGTYTWDCVKLEYVHDTTQAGWSVEPYVKCVVKNYGSKAVNLDFSANVDKWAKYFGTNGNPFEDISTVRLAGESEYTFEFRNDIELKWNYDVLNAEAYAVAIGGTPTVEENTFQLNITKAE